jgi:CxxC motif-containing protein (DUF1111 family)
MAIQKTGVCSLLLFLLLVVSQPCSADLLTGGDTTVFDKSANAFGLPATNLPLEEHPRFFAGNAFFNTNWVDASSEVNGRDGLGPLFNVRSCSACHFKDGRGQPPAGSAIPNGWLMRISIPGATEKGAPKPDPVYGNQISVRALPGAEPEARIRIKYKTLQDVYPDYVAYQLLEPTYSLGNWAYGDPHKELLSSPRVASAVFGLGLLDAIPQETILNLADEEDANGDGISGRPNWVWSSFFQAKKLGRFGWKANKATLIDQTAGAFVGDMGITSSLFSGENHTEAQALSEVFPSGGSPEIEQRDLEDVVFYLQALAVPAARIEDRNTFKEGKSLFSQLRCTTCHVPILKTSQDYPINALAGQTIRPYTDLLLHDMGEALADGRPDFEASGSEWRTPPLWGIGLISKVNGHTRLMHDGRARNIEEAILWHGGEAEASKQEFMNLPSLQRALVIKFVESL